MRATYMQLSDVKLLEDWGRNLREMFLFDTPYVVGSALQRADYRDVDVRIMLADETFDWLEGVVNVDRLNVCLSLWGRTATGLPIDCQVQQRSAANKAYGKQRRNPLGMNPVCGFCEEPERTHSPRELASCRADLAAQRKDDQA